MELKRKIKNIGLGWRGGVAGWLSMGTLKKNILKLSLGNIVNFASLFILSALIARVLGTENFGIFFLIISIANATSELADLGLNTLVVRWLAIAGEEARPKGVGVFQIVFGIKLAAIAVAMLVGFKLTPFIAAEVLKKPAVAPLLYYAWALFGGSVLSLFLTSVLQALNKFKLISVLNALSGVFRLAIIGALAIAGKLTLASGIFAYLIVPLGIAVYISVILHRHQMYVKIERRFDHFISVYKFSVWLFLSVIVAIISGKVGLITVSHYRSNQELSYYGLSSQIDTFFNFFLAAIATVILPKLSETLDKAEIISLTRTITRKLKVLSLLIFLSALPISLLIIIFYGPAFINALPIICITLLGTALFFLSTGWVNGILALGKSRYSFYSSLGALAVNLALNLIIVPKVGAIGSALAYLGAVIAVLSITYLGFKRESKLISNNLQV